MGARADLGKAPEMSLPLLDICTGIAEAVAGTVRQLQSVPWEGTDLGAAQEICRTRVWGL